MEGQVRLASFSSDPAIVILLCESKILFFFSHLHANHNSPFNLDLFFTNEVTSISPAPPLFLLSRLLPFLLVRNLPPDSPPSTTPTYRYTLPSLHIPRLRYDIGFVYFHCAFPCFPGTRNFCFSPSDTPRRLSSALLICVFRQSD